MIIINKKIYLKSHSCQQDISIRWEYSEVYKCVKTMIIIK